MAQLFKYLLTFLLYLNVLDPMMVMGKLRKSLYSGSWCDPELCKLGGGKHVACENPGKFGRLCPRDAKLINITPYKDLFVEQHNILRNRLAMGQIPGYKPAAKMATMVWDEELAYLASLNAKTCDFEHDKCYNTYKFRNTGQSLSGSWTRKDLRLNASELIIEGIGGWFSEHELIDMSYINNFRVDSKFEEYGHFTEFAVDRNTHVGCAMIQFSVPHQALWDTVNIVCDYASVHALDEPIYRAGRPASQCSTGRNPYYPGLCSYREYFNPNIFDYDLF